MKPNPETQARIDAADLAALAKEKANTAPELTLARYASEAESAGVESIQLKTAKGGILISLIGRYHVEAICPTGQPLALYAAAALSLFKQGLSTGPVLPSLPPDVPVVEDIEKREGYTRYAHECRRRGAEPIRWEEYDNAAGSYLDLAAATQGVQRQEGETDAELRAKAIAARAGNTSKPPAAGAGQRKPLALPLCKECKSQPVYKPAAEFCGAECAKDWHVRTVMQKR